jgi:hypothetical protein
MHSLRKSFPAPSDLDRRTVSSVIRRSRLATAFAFVSALALAGAATYAANSVSHTKLVRFFAAQAVPADGSTVNGSSATLKRGESAVWVRVNTTELLPGAYTNWWVIFNNPSACTDPCDLDDLFNLTQRAAVQSSVLFAAGGVVRHTGVGHFVAHLEEGVLPTGPGQVGFGPGLLNAEGAEIHYLIRYHGPASADPTILQKQTTHIAGGCFNLPPQESGQPGNDPVEAHRLFPCYDIQAAMFPPEE